MSSIVWENLSLAAAFVIAIVGIPLWVTIRHPDTGPDLARAGAYQAAKSRASG